MRIEKVWDSLSYLSHTELTFATRMAMIEAAIAGTELAAAMNVAPATSGSISKDSVRTWDQFV